MDCLYCGTSTDAEGKAVCDDCADRETAPFDLKLLCAFAAFGILLAVVSAFRTLAWSTEWAVVALLVLIVAALQTAVVYGLFTIERWAWPGGLVVFGAVVLLALARTVAGDPFAVLEGVIALVAGAYLYTQSPVYHPESLHWYPPEWLSG